MLHPMFMLSFNQSSRASTTDHQGPFGFTDIPKQCEVIGDPISVIDTVIHKSSRYYLCKYHTEWTDDDGDLDLDECGDWIFLCSKVKDSE